MLAVVRAELRQIDARHFQFWHFLFRPQMFAAWTVLLLKFRGHSRRENARTFRSGRFGDLWALQTLASETRVPFPARPI